MQLGQNIEMFSNFFTALIFLMLGKFGLPLFGGSRMSNLTKPSRRIIHSDRADFSRERRARFALGSFSSSMEEEDDDDTFFLNCQLAKYRG